jgi:hypothetical protein
MTTAQWARVRPGSRFEPRRCRHAAALEARLVAQLPGEHGGVVAVAHPGAVVHPRDQVADELGLRADAARVVEEGVLVFAVGGRHAHHGRGAAVVGPVVGHRQQQRDAPLGRQRQHRVERAESRLVERPVGAAQAPGAVAAIEERVGADERAPEGERLIEDVVHVGEAPTRHVVQQRIAAHAARHEGSGRRTRLTERATGHRDEPRALTRPRGWAHARVITSRAMTWRWISLVPS